MWEEFFSNTYNMYKSIFEWEGGCAHVCLSMCRCTCVCIHSYISARTCVYSVDIVLNPFIFFRCLVWHIHVTKSELMWRFFSDPTFLAFLFIKQFRVWHQFFALLPTTRDTKSAPIYHRNITEKRPFDSSWIISLWFASKGWLRTSALKRREEPVAIRKDWKIIVRFTARLTRWFWSRV